MGIATPARMQTSPVSLADALDTTGVLPARNEVLVALFEPLAWSSWLDEADVLLDPSEQRRSQSRHDPAERDSLVLCYALHRLLLGRVMGCVAGAVPLHRDASGCPRIAGGNLFTSLSHAGTGAAVAITAAGPVGVDIEPASRASVMPDIADRISHPDDQGIPATPGTARARALLRLWVRKEAFLKAAGTGLAQEMDTLAVPDDVLLPLPDGTPSRVRMLDAGTDWVAAAAAPPGSGFKVAWLHPRRA